MLLLFSNPRLSACSGSLLESKLEKNSWNSPRGTKGLLYRRIWKTRLLSLLLPSFLFSPCQRAPASRAGGGGHTARGQTPPVPTGECFPNVHASRHAERTRACQPSIAPGTPLAFFFYLPLSTKISPQNATVSDHMQQQGSDQLPIQVSSRWQQSLRCST